MMPARTANTMSDAIALSSPSGHMSTRARREAERRLNLALFGPGGLQREPTIQPCACVSQRRQAATLRDLADRGMKRLAYARAATRLEALAAACSHA